MDNVQTPLFIPASSTAKGSGLAAGTPSLNIDDIFGDCFFTPSGETVFLDHEDGDAIGEMCEKGRFFCLAVKSSKVKCSESGAAGSGHPQP